MDYLLEQGLTTAINNLFGRDIVISNDDRSSNPRAEPLTVDRIYEKLYQYVSVNTEVPNDKIFVKMMYNGKTINIPYDAAFSIRKVQELIQDKEGIHFTEQRLYYDEKLTNSGMTLGDYNIQRGSTLELYEEQVGGGCAHYYIDKSLYDPKWNFDFCKIKKDSASFARGGKLYTRPLGSMRYAIKVLDKYSDNSWLGKSRNRKHSVAKEWTVAYHGTKEMNVSGILNDRICLEKGRRFRFGRGIYCTPDPKTALQYAATYNFQGKKYRLILQTRVNPDTLVVVRKKTDREGEYWLLPNEEDIRPYGVCVYPGAAN